MRNDFAHDKGPLSFQTQQCQDRMRVLVEGVKRLFFRPNSGVSAIFDALAKIDAGDRRAFLLVLGCISVRLESIRLKLMAGFTPFG